MKKIAVIGLGYIGLPLAHLLATKYAVVGFDVNPERIMSLKRGEDATLQLDKEKLLPVLTNQNPFIKSDAGLYVSSVQDDLQDASIYIIAVPTLVTKTNTPDLAPLYTASNIVGAMLSKGNIIIYESTVYPGVTEEECVPLLEQSSGLTFNKDFFVGYSPERINPGDKLHTVETVIKITSGSTPEAAKTINTLYQSVITAGTYLAPSIKIAEAAKIVENCQRDINIAFMNELAKMFSQMNIDIHEVLNAARTKWNFLPFTPGLVGGHCIGVNPYYLAYKAQQHGYYPEMLLAGRRINESMATHIVTRVIKAMIKKNIPVNGATILNLGFTFKENCSDIRNTKVVDVIRELQEYGADVITFDPWANPEDVALEYNIITTQIIEDVVAKKYDAIILTVDHEDFKHLDLEAHLKKDGLIYDVKGAVKRNLDTNL